MAPLLYFAAIGVTLGAIWLFQNGQQASAGEHHVPRSGNPDSGGGGGGGGELLPGVAGTPYTYSHGETPAPSSMSAYGGVTDSSAAPSPNTTTATYPDSSYPAASYGFYPPGPARPTAQGVLAGPPPELRPYLPTLAPIGGGSGSARYV